MQAAATRKFLLRKRKYQGATLNRHRREEQRKLVCGKLEADHPA
jgi:hypothetical protein|tara:strand:- start:209 stop:340 length:132 start_codon:yes stop_codon:yes gene_type:complete